MVGEVAGQAGAGGREVVGVAGVLEGARAGEMGCLVGGCRGGSRGDEGVGDWFGMEGKKLARSRRRMAGWATWERQW